jgi:hypothetical protein
VGYMDETHLTIVFNVFVLLQVANEFNARMLGKGLFPFGGLHRAPLFIAIIIVTCIVQYLGVTYFGTFMKCRPLSKALWMRCILVSLVPLPLGVLLRLIPVTEPKIDIWKEVEDDAVEDLGNDRLLPGANTHLRGKARFVQAVLKVQAQLKVAGALAEASGSPKMGQSLTLHH